MTEPNYMNRTELLKLAALDVFGLLEDYEADLYERSLHHATATVQDEVVALQADFASDRTLHSGEEPDLNLREKVLERVAQAVEEETRRLAPIASFGGRRAVEATPVHSRVNGGSDRAATIWRGLSFALAACLVITSVVIIQISQTSMTISAKALDKWAQEELEDVLGIDFDVFISSPNVDVVVLKPEGADNRAFGQVYINPQSRKVFIVGLGLSKDTGYTVRAINDAGHEVLTSEFSSNGVLACVLEDKVDIEGLDTVTWEVRDPGGDLVLRA